MTAGPVPLVRLRGLAKSFGRVEAVAPLDLAIEAGDFLAILGPSGCGKTTLLRMIGGFVVPSAGTIEIEGRDVTALGPERRPTNMVFQGFGLFPHMSVRQNVGYGLKIGRVEPQEASERVAEAIALVRLGDLAERSPDQLSGGQQQRLALARALVMAPKVLLLDEPLGALDLKLRLAMQEELRRIHRQTGGTFVFVTHDQGEALGLANRIAVMEAGRIVQEGSPEEIYAQPATRFVSTFIGEANVLPGRRRDGRVTLDTGLCFDEDGGPDGPVVCVVRPEKVRVAGAPPDAGETMEGEIVDLVYFGAYVRVELRLAGGSALVAHDPDPGLRHRLAPGQRVSVGWAAADRRVVEDG